MMVRSSERRWHNSDLDPLSGVTIKGSGFNLNTAADATALVDMIISQRPLLYLELEGNTLGVEAAKEIGKALESKPEFEAAFWKDLFTGRLKTEIPKALNFLLGGVDLSDARLQCLDLSDNAIGPVGMAGLAPFFKSRSSFSLKELIFNNNGWGPEGGTMLAEALLDCYRRSVDAGGEIFQLKVFVCGRSRIENKAGIALAAFFKEIKSLEEIHMPQNGIYTEGINALTDAFRHNVNLRVINLNDNTISPEGCIKLSECLTHLVHLKELNVGDCLILTEGVHQLSGPLSECSNLEKIMLDSNEIDDEGGMEIANILAKLPKLNEVNLCGNEFTSRAVEDIQRILSRTVSNVQIDAGEEDNENWGENAGTVSETEEGDQTGDFDDDVKNFLDASNYLNYTKLLPDPAARLCGYFKHVVVGDSEPGKTYAELCVDTAFTVCELEATAAGSTTSSSKCFSSLLGEVVHDRFFATHLLNRLGLLGRKNWVLEKVPNNTIHQLTEFISKTELSNTTLASLHMFLKRYSANAGPTSTQIKKLFQTLDTKLYD